MKHLITAALILISTLFVGCSSGSAPTPQTQNGYSLTLSPDTITAEMTETQPNYEFFNLSFFCSTVGIKTPSGDVVTPLLGVHFEALNQGLKDTLFIDAYELSKTYGLEYVARVNTERQLLACFRNTKALPSDQRVTLTLTGVTVNGETLTKLSLSVLLRK
jgi:hypothetical protein